MRNYKHVLHRSHKNLLHTFSFIFFYVRLFAIVTNTWEQQFKRDKDLFWSMVLEILVKGWLDSRHGSWRARQNTLVLGPWNLRAGNLSVWETETARGQGQDALQRGTPSDIPPPATPTSEVFVTSQTRASSLGPSFFTMWLLEGDNFNFKL